VIERFEDWLFGAWWHWGSVLLLVVAIIVVTPLVLAQGGDGHSGEHCTHHTTTLHPVLVGKVLIDQPYTHCDRWSK
jgi:hypothetical protein